MRVLCLLLSAALLLSCADPQPSAAPPHPAPAQKPAAEDIPAIEGGTRIPPFDDGQSDPTFHAFRDRLQQIVRSKDAAALEAIVDSKIRVSFGASNGIAAFRQQWKPSSPDSRIWTELDRILSSGGSFQPTPDGRRFVAPYVFSNWPDSVDSFEYLAVTCHDAVALAEPSATAKPLGRLDFQALKIGPQDAMRKGERNPSWRQVILPDGRAAYVEAACARSPLDYRAAFEKKDGEWKMVYLIAGD